MHKSIGIYKNEMLVFRLQLFSEVVLPIHKSFTCSVHDENETSETSVVNAQRSLMYIVFMN
mgnify:CR=1 FL=1